MAQTLTQKQASNTKRKATLARKALERQVQIRQIWESTAAQDHRAATLAELIQDGALFVVNHSGGKDSQAMLIKLLQIVPVSQILVVHADLGDVEWAGAKELAHDQAAAAGAAWEVATPTKTFLGMVEARAAAIDAKWRAPLKYAPAWPSSDCRQCTSDLKRDPIAKVVRATGAQLIVHCIGIRAQESTSRALESEWKFIGRETIDSRLVLAWHPILAMTTDEVFATIKEAGQEPHPMYAAGNERLSCVFCIMGSQGDLQRGYEARPDLFERYLATERKVNSTMFADGSLASKIIPIRLAA